MTAAICRSTSRGGGMGCWPTWPMPVWTRLRACDTHGVCYVIRLKENWKPKVDYLARGEVTQAFFPGTDLDARCWRTKRSSWMAALLMRMFMSVSEKSGCMSAWLASSRRKATVFSSRSAPADRAAAGLANLYRVRWEVELSIRLDKAVNRLDAIDAEQPCTLKTLLYASLIASTIAALLAHTHNLQTRPQQPNAPRAEAPLHPRRLALRASQFPANPSPRPLSSRGPRPRNVGTRLRRCSCIAEKTRIGAVGHPSSISCVAGSANPWRVIHPSHGDVSHGHIQAAA